MGYIPFLYAGTSYMTDLLDNSNLRFARSNSMMTQTSFLIGLRTNLSILDSYVSPRAGVLATARFKVMLTPQCL